MEYKVIKNDIGEYWYTNGKLHREDGPTLSMPEFTTLDELIATKTSDYKLVGHDPMPNIKVQNSANGDIK